MVLHHCTWWSADGHGRKLANHDVLLCSLRSFSAISARVHHNLSLSVSLGSPRSSLCLSRRVVELDHIPMLSQSSTEMVACRSRCNQLSISDIHHFCV